MFTSSEIKACFDQLVGWRNSSKSPTCFDDLTVELQNSTSGFYVNAIEGIELTVLDEMLSADEVDLNTYLANVHQDSAIELINKFMIMQKEKLSTKALLSNFSIGVRNTNIRNLESPLNRFVGFEIYPVESNNTKVELSEIGLQLSVAQTLDIYFYSSTSIDPIHIQNVNVATASSINWITLDDEFVAQYHSQTQGSGARYYIGYYESDLVGSAVNTELPCGTCGNSPMRKVKKYMTLNSIQLDEGDTYIDKTLFDIERIGRNNRTHGMHMKVNATCDVSDVVCTNKNLFASAYQKTIAIRIFWDLFNSERINRKTVLNKDDARLNAERLELQLEDEMKTLSIDFSHVDPICQPCRRKGYGKIQLR